MTAPMSDAEVREALARAERASAGPWLTGILDGPFNPETCAKYVEACLDRGALAEFWLVSCVKPDGVADVCHVGNGPTSPQNADFLAAARTDVPRLVATIREREAEIAELRRWKDTHSVGSTLRTRAETAEARCRELEGFVRGFLHASSGTRNENAAALLSRLETRAQVLLSPPPSHTCQIHRASAGASDCGLEPCEEATVHRDRGASRPKMRCAICGLVEHVGRCASSPPPSPEATPFEADTMTHEAAKCATCGGEGGVSRIEAVGHDEYGDLVGEVVSEPCPDCHGCGGAK